MMCGDVSKVLVGLRGLGETFTTLVYDRLEALVYGVLMLFID